MMNKQFAKPEGLRGRIATYMMNMGNQALYKGTYRSIPKQFDMTILDIGYGNGFLLKKLLKNGYKEVYGLEISETMTSLVTKKLKSYIADASCHLGFGGVESMPFENRLFDFVYTINTIYFWKSLDIGLQEIRRVLKEDGQCVLAFYDERFLKALPYTRNGFQIYSNEEIENALQRNGFVVKDRVYKKFHTAICFVCVIDKEG